MGSMLFKAIGLLVVVGAIFAAGFVVGGGFAQQAAEHDVQKTLVGCLPLEDAAALQQCIAGGGQ